MIAIRPHNWSELQHYKERRPPWIKLHRKLLDDMKWHCLPVASRALAPMLWLLASEDKQGAIVGDEVEIAFRLRISKEELVEALKPLLQNDMFEDASILLAGRLQLAPKSCSESESETETETEGRRKRSASTPKGAPALAEKKALTSREEWEARLAGYRPSEGKRDWNAFWGPRPDSAGTVTTIPVDLLTKWRVQNSVVNGVP